MSQNSDVQSAKFLASCTFVISADVLLRLLRLSRVMLNKLKYSVLFVQFHIAFTNVMLTSSLMYLFLLTCGSCYPPQAIWKKPAIVEDIYIDRQFSGIFIAGSKSWIVQTIAAQAGLIVTRYPLVVTPLHTTKPLRQIGGLKIWQFYELTFIKGFWLPWGQRV